jgi:hypothetical protein
MKKLLALSLCAALLLTGCGKPQETTPSESIPETTPPEVTETVKDVTGPVVEIRLDGQKVTIAGDAQGVYTSRDIIYYENRTEYESGFPYGEGEDWQRHSWEEAAAHLVVNITVPGTYRLSGKLDKGQIRIDLGEDAYADPEAVVNLILDGAEITSTVAPAVLFQNVYECGSGRSGKKARPDVDTTAAGANLILAENSRNILNGSHVAKIYADQEGEEKLWKQDGALYSRMSMNVYGPGALEIHADNEGLGTELHLSIFGGDIRIHSGNDGINTNADDLSVTAIHGGTLRISAGLRQEGDGIDSNGYLVIYGGTVIAAAHPASDFGLDSDLGSFIHGGTVVALGAPMDWPENDSRQVTMNLQFADMQTGDIRITREDGTEIFAFNPAQDEVIGTNSRGYLSAVISCPGFRGGEGYHVFVGGAQMAYTHTDVWMGPGSQRPGPGIGLPEDRDPGDMPEPPEGDFTLPPPPSEGMEPVPQGTAPQAPPGEQQENANIRFVLQDEANFFSGLFPIS